MFKKILTMCLIIIAVGRSETVAKYVKEIPLSEIEKNVAEFTQKLDSGDFASDVRITNDYTPHTYGTSICSDLYRGETYCAFGATYSGCPACVIYKTTDGGHNWAFFGGMYTPGGEHIFDNSIAVTENYVCLAYTITTSGNWGTVETYRVPRSGGSGVFTDLPPTPAGRPAVTGIESWVTYGDTVDLVLVYHYSSTAEAIVFFQSPDGGCTWIKEYTFELGTRIKCPSISHCHQWHHIFIVWPLSAGNCDLRLARSTNNGSSWETQTLDLHTMTVNAGLCTDASYGFIYVFATLYYPSSGRVYVSFDNGTSWQIANLTNSYVWYGAERRDATYVSGYLPSDNSVRFQHGTLVNDFTGSWTRINDASAQVCVAHDVCSDINAGALVAWLDDREGGVRKAFCDGYYWQPGIEEGKNQAITSNRRLFLAQNYPNPVSSNTVIEYSLSEETEVDLKIYDINGKQVSILVNRIQKPGNHRVAWDIRNTSEKQLPNGVYFYRLAAGDYTNTKKMVIVR